MHYGTLWINVNKVDKKGKGRKIRQTRKECTRQFWKNRESMGAKEATTGRSFEAMRYERSHFLPQIAGIQATASQETLVI